MKSYIDIEHSKQLAEILPLESADTSYSFNFNTEAYELTTVPYKDWIVPKYAQPNEGFGQVIPCWSLSALLEVFRKINDNVEIWNDHEDWFVSVLSCETTSRDLLDACVAMVQILHEKKIINFNNKED